MTRPNDRRAGEMRCAAGVAARDDELAGSRVDSPGGDATGSPSRPGWLSLHPTVLCAVALAGAAVVLPRLGAMPLWGSEGRWALIARAMWRTGDLFRPQMGSRLYWDKPLLSYWQILPVVAARGRVDEFAVRLPSAAWAIVLVCLTWDLGRRWYDRSVAALSSIVLASSLGFVFWGRNAQVEMTNAALTLLLLWIFSRHRADAGTRWVYAVAIVAGLGANMKGLTVYGAPAFCVLCLGLLERDWSWLPSWRVVLPAGVVSLAVFLSLPLFACLAMRTWEPLSVAWRENVVRYFAPFDHQDPAWTYFVRIFDLFAPWSLLLPVALWRRLPVLWRRTERPPEALVYAVATFAFFTLSGSRRPYYLLPVLPFLALLVGELLRDWAAGRLTARQESWVSGYGFVLGGALLACLVVWVVALPFARALPLDPTGLGWSAGAVALAGAVVIGGVRRRSPWRLAAATLGVWLVYVTGIVPFAAAQPGLRDDAARLRDLARPCGLLGIGDTRLEFYLGEPCTDLPDEATALAWARAHGGFVVTSSKLAEPAWHQVYESGWRVFLPAGGAEPATTR